MDCIVCKRPAGFFSHKCEDGAICKECYDKTPAIFKSKQYDAGVVRFMCRNYDQYNEEMCRKFKQTHKLGNLHFDSEHLLAVVGRINKDGTIDEGNPNIFSLANIESLNFVMTNTQAISEKKVTCDIKLQCSFFDSFWKIDEIVSRGETCFAKKNGDILEFSLPAGVQIIWDDIIKYVNNSRNKTTQIIDNELVTEDDLNYFKARVLFMVSQGFDENEVEDTYNRLKLAFGDDEERMEVIDKSKFLLLDHIALRDC